MDLQDPSPARSAGADSTALARTGDGDRQSCSGDRGGASKCSGRRGPARHDVHSLHRAARALDEELHDRYRQSSADPTVRRSMLALLAGLPAIGCLYHGPIPGYAAVSTRALSVPMTVVARDVEGLSCI